MVQISRVDMRTAVLSTLSDAQRLALDILLSVLESPQPAPAAVHVALMLISREFPDAEADGDMRVLRAALANRYVGTPA